VELEGYRRSEEGRLTPPLADGFSGIQPAAALGEC
jgi:hypothetical protein